MNRYLKLLDHLPKSWSIDQDSRIQGVKGSSEKDRKKIHTEKSLTLGTVFLYKYTLKILRSKGREDASVYIICIKPFAFT